MPSKGEKGVPARAPEPQESPPFTTKRIKIEQVLPMTQAPVQVLKPIALPKRPLSCISDSSDLGQAKGLQMGPTLGSSMFMS